MKNVKLLTLSLIMAIGFIQAKATEIPGNTFELKGASNTHLGNYQIREIAPVTLNGDQLRTFELTYQNAEKPVTIYLNEKSNCRDYIVRSKNLEICYTCKKSGFGARLLSGKYLKYKPELNAMFLAEDELEKQSRIADGGQPIPDALGMIASYYPNLFKRADLLN